MKKILGLHLFLNIDGKESKLNFDSSAISIGRTEANDVQIPSPNISRNHAVIINELDAVYIKDLKSTNGTRVNNVKIEANKKIKLAEKDIINLGLDDSLEIKLKFDIENEHDEFDEIENEYSYEGKAEKKSVGKKIDSEDQAEKKVNEEVKNVEIKKPSLNEQLEASIKDFQINSENDNKDKNVSINEIENSNLAEIDKTEKNKNLKDGYLPPLPESSFVEQDIKKAEIKNEEDDLGQLKHKLNNKLDALESEFNKNAEEHFKKLKKAELIDFENMKNEIIDKFHSMVSEGKENINNGIELAQEESRNIIITANEMASELVNETKERISQLVLEYESKIKTADKKIEDASTEYDKIVEEANKKLDKANSLLAVKEAEAGEILDSIEKQKEQTLKELDKLKSKAEYEYNSTIENANNERELILEETKKEVESYKLEMQQKSDDEFTRTIYAAKEKNIELESRIKSLNLEIVELEKKRDQEKNLVNETTKKIESLEIENSKLDKARNIIEAEFEKREKQLKNISKELDILTETFANKQDKFYSFKQSVDKRVNKKKLELHELKKEYQSYEERYDQLKEKEISKKLDLKDLEDKITQSRKSFDELSKRMAEVESNITNFSQVRKEQTQELKAKKDLALKDIESLKKQAEQEAKEIVKTARTEGAQILKRVRDKENDVISAHEERIRKKNEKVIKESKEKAKKIELEAKNNAEKRKEQVELEVKQMRESLVSQGEELKRQAVIDEKNKLIIQTNRLKKDFQVLFYTQLSQLLEKRDKETVKLEVPNLIKQTVDKVFLEDYSEEHSLDNFLTLDEDPSVHQKNVKKYWTMTAGLIVLLFIGVFSYQSIFKAIDTKARIVASVNENAEKKKMREKIEERKKVKAFTPEVTETYKNSYTDRVIYTKDYVKNELDTKYRESWILALEEFIVKEKKLSEELVIPFLAHEVNLINELNLEKSSINGFFVKEGIERMKKIETQFLDKIKKTIKDKNVLIDILVFKKEFYLNAYGKKK